jgi:hypothetical protein
MSANDEIWVELKKLRHGYDDLRTEIANITNKKTNATNTSRRGALTASGVTAEQILKYIYRKEGKEKNGKPAEKLMLDELISELSERHKPSLLPTHVVTHLRTVQAWRNMGGHDKGDISEVNDETLYAVNIALNAVVSWFFGNYLGGEFAYLSENNEVTSINQNDSEEITPYENNWREFYWHAMRNGQLKKLDEVYLKSLQDKHKISDEKVSLIKSSFIRNLEDFKNVIAEALEDSKLEEHEAIALEHARVLCCISQKEATEILKSFTLTNSDIPPLQKEFSWILSAFENFGLKTISLEPQF